MRVNLSSVLSLALLAIANPLVPRGLEKCKTLSAKSNDGGRKIAVVIDESGSMSSSDPYDLRIQAGKAVNDWLISSGEAKGGKSADLVSVIGFDDSPRLLYPLGDPGGADKIFDQITILGGTYIAGGVDMAIDQLTLAGHDPTKDRSGIVVLSDGSDTSLPTLVKSIQKAGDLGIRLSFGFLTTYGYYYQDATVLSAILATGGMYATIDGAGAQNAFVNLMIVHGLTAKDNPAPDKSTTVYNGLSVAFVLGSDGTSILTYTAQAGESLTFTVSSITAGALNVTAIDSSGNEVGKAAVSRYASSPVKLQAKASSSGDLQIKVQGQPRLTDAMFVVGVNSSIPLVNCTLGDDGGKKGLSTGAKAGIGVSVPILLGLAGVGSFFAWKYWKGGFPGGSSPSAPTQQPPMNDFKEPYNHTTEIPTPGPQPPGSHPGWMMPPPKVPNAPTNPNNNGKPDQYNYNQPHSPNPNGSDLTHQPNNNQPYNPNGSDLPHQPNSNQPYNPNGSDLPNNYNNNTQPYNPNPNGSDLPHNYNNNTQPYGPSGNELPQNPNNCQPYNPQGSDLPHNFGDNSQPYNPSGNDMPHNPNGSDGPHNPNPNGSDGPHNPNPNGSDGPHNPNDGQPQDPNQQPLDRGDHSHPPQDNRSNLADPSNPNPGDQWHPGQDNPSPPAQPDPAPPNDPTQPGQNPEDPHAKRLPTPRFPFGKRRRKEDEEENQNQNQNHHQSQSVPQSYSHNVTYTPLVYGTEGTVTRPQQPQYHVQHEMSAISAPRPDHIELDSQQHSVQYTSSTQQYQYGYASNQSQYQQYPSQPQGGGSSAQSSPRPANFSFPRSFSGSPAPQSEGQHVTYYSTQQPRDGYNVSPVLQPAELSQNTRYYSSDSRENQADVITPVNAKQGSISRKPVGGF